jgi:hypothetical protein
MSATLQAPAPYADQPITPGLDVFTLDNRRLGKVKETAESYFKVDARFRRDFWLARNQVAYTDFRCVGMLFRSDEAELYKLAQPSDDGRQRSFERKAPPTGDDYNDANWRGRFPLS